MLRISHIENLNNSHLYSNIKGPFCKVFLAYNHNLVKVYMECNHTHLSHNSLVSPKKSDHQGCDYKGDLLYNTLLSGSNYKDKWAIINYKRIHSYISGISHDEKYKNFTLKFQFTPSAKQIPNNATNSNIMFL
jgi:hypothetical protein